jgi:L-ribulose-5-phosphate 4-epimerase
MPLANLRQTVFEANMALHASGLVLYTFGNVSGIDRERNQMVIKPSGVPYAELNAKSMVAVDLTSGEVVSGDLNPSSDTPTHLEIYRSFPACGGVVHTHSQSATALAQAGLPLRCMGTTHADYFHGDVPITRPLSRQETTRDYEHHTGVVIAETFEDLDPQGITAVLVAFHGPFAWGKDPGDAVHNAVVLEYLAKMEHHVLLANPTASRPPNYLIEKHYRRKHGQGAYYGQTREKSEIK